VKSHFPNVDISKLETDPNEDADLEALQTEVQVATNRVVEQLDL
jgi:hypothetical protein